MNKYSIISAIAIAVIIGTVMYGIWGIYSVEKLQLRAEKNPFKYFDLSNSEKIRVCNPTPFFVSFSGISLDVYYQGDIQGEFKVGPETLDPNASKILNSDFTSESFSAAQYLFMHMDGEFSGDVPIRLDPNKMMVNTTFETKIIGIIPYEQTVSQSAFDFSKMMNEDISCSDID